ncbi:glycoside hydrolase family 19 protein [Segetibacter sp. 3557_3]|uniref:glycoside hydrolase family 19 protein n=1 Tax=Segetibacter sp. 3557_3 TaxID=2547429 RepID=UPI0014043024|nr:glycoside hydrolase family 19 protein [Segetibacter sp. 3557_3]
MLVLDRKKLLNGYVSRFGPLTNSLADAFRFLLSQIEKDDRFSNTESDRRQLAYCMATFKWETAHTMHPIDEYGGDPYFNKRYGPSTSVGKMLGNTKPGDGALFHGRGYVQITGRRNYAKARSLTGVDLVTQPDLAKDPVVAYQIAIQGMKEGWFTGKKLSQFINNEKADFENARTIINGYDKAEIIANIARRYSEILRESLT